MGHTIFNVYVEMQSQEQCDRMKQFCIDNGLLDYEIDSDFYFDEKYKYFVSSKHSFYISALTWRYHKATENEFLQLLKNYKKVKDNE